MTDEAVQFPTLERAPTLSDRVTDSVLQMISSNALKPGDRLPSERDLGVRFGVSRTVVREALRSLAAKGVLDVRSGSGAVVARVGVDTASQTLRLFVQGSRAGTDGDLLRYEQINDVREMLETRVARIAAREAQAAHLDRLRDLHAQMEAAKDDVELASSLDVAFHRQIAVATRNPLFVVMLDSIEPALLEIRRKTLGSPDRPDKALRAHALILERIVAADPEGAERAMNEHLADSRAVWAALGGAV
ncbi:MULTISPECIES: FadR/GntR family transcriptional regulator [Dactylosporangium]|uniref:GntR family transcriptional regulator n=2 Tax=Dactylosporangium TaxID=35753 RepID=A0A9W6KWM8_9ACTN|nr:MULTISPECIES: FadR/GntR family transcriptional regulator [Dactylosporangium]UAB93984.1 FadR family transcriptional regulator [Dactylosporangium vinaceum]UWZ42390.1 FadR family transcriptional regulator [Dactylosporangium matsuzakiense]GLL07926.1 GntR family transcriptional regulator [Dactylosporangium matsuzakiense]